MNIRVVGKINMRHFGYASKERHNVHSMRLSLKVLHDLEASLYLCFSGETHNSSEIHDSIDLSVGERSSKMRETVRLAHEMLNALTDENLSIFDRNMNENWELKKQYSLKITNEKLEQKISFLRSAGATSAKLLGAGGGGYFLVRVPNNNNKVFMASCAKIGLTPERVLFDMDGVTDW